MLMASSNTKTCEDEKIDVEKPRHRQRKRSLDLKNFVAAIFDEEKIDESQGIGTRHPMVLELSQLPRDRKRSFAVRVIDRLLSRADHSQSQKSETTDKSEDQGKMRSAYDEHEAGASYWKQEENNDMEKDIEISSCGACGVVPDADNRELEGDEEDRTDSSVEVSASAESMKQVVVPVAEDKEVGLPYFGFAAECELGDKVLEKDCSDTIDLWKPRKSVAFSLPESSTPAQFIKNEDSAETFKLDNSTEKPVIMNVPIRRANASATAELGL